MLKLIGKKISTILCSKILFMFILTYGYVSSNTKTTGGGQAGDTKTVFFKKSSKFGTKMFLMIIQNLLRESIFQLSVFKAVLFATD